MTPGYRKNGRVPAGAEPLQVTNPHAAGIDVHSQVHFVAVQPPGSTSPVAD